MSKSKKMLGLIAAGLIGAGSMFSGAVVTGVLQETYAEAATWEGWLGNSHIFFRETNGKQIMKDGFSFKVKILEIDPDIRSNLEGDVGYKGLKNGSYSSAVSSGMSDALRHFTIKTTYLIYDIKVPDGYVSPGEIKFRIDSNKKVIPLNEEGKDILSVKKAVYDIEKDDFVLNDKGGD